MEGDGVEVVKEKKEKVSSEYFGRLMNEEGGGELSPVESMFQKYMKKSLIGFEEYYQVGFSCGVDEQGAGEFV